MRADDAPVPVSSPYPVSISEELTARFYEWEARGRGWQLWDYPVELEPPFVPFMGHYFLPRQYHDDARHETLTSSFVRRVKELVLGPPKQASPEPSYVPEEPEPDLFFPDILPVELQCSIPADERIRHEAALRLLMSLPHFNAPTCFEIIGTYDKTVVQFATHAHGRELQTHIKAYFPDVVVREADNYLIEQWKDEPHDASIVIDFGLSEEFMLPLQSLKSFDTDPFIAVVSSLEPLGPGEIGVFQILFEPTQNPWAASVLRAVTDWNGRPFFANAPEIAALARHKVSQPLFSALLRIGVGAASEERMWEIARAMGGALRQFSNPIGNSFIPLNNEGYEDDLHELDLLARTSHRSGMILGCEELVSLAHLPSASVRSPKLVRETKKTKALPGIASGKDLILGENYHEGQVATASVDAEQRTKHTYIIGASGTGKSHLLLNLLIQDLEAGNGFAVLDPHGDLIDRLLSYVPESRLGDVILFDPADEEHPIGFNILQAHSTLEKQLLSSDLVAVFKRLSTSWGDQMTSVLGNAILAFLESNQGGTLADMRRFLVEKAFRHEFLRSVTDHEVLYYWYKEFPLLSGRPQAPLLTRLDTFLRPRLVRHIVAQKENKLDFSRIMNDGKILLAKLSQGAIGEENAYLLGTLLVSKFYQLALSRQELQESVRRPFYLYIDEFHHFITPSLSTILSGARKYRLGLTLAHQDMRQLQSRDSELTSAVLTNPYTRICFRVGDFDARALESGFAYFDAKDLQNLGRGEAIARIERTDYDFNLATLPLPDLDTETASHRRKAVIDHSRRAFGTPLADVEAFLQQAQAPHTEDMRPAKQREVKQRQTKQQKAAAPPPASASPPRTTETPSKARAPREDVELPEAEPSTQGRGGRQHKYLQELIKRWAESKGWRASVEKTILDGLGSIDVALENDETSIACEISVTSTPDYELGNVEKCLAAGFDVVALISADEKTLQKLRSHVSKHLDTKHVPQVKFFSPEELFAYLAEVSSPGTDEVVGGYKVKVRLKSGNKEDATTRRKAVSDVILQAMRRMKDQGKS